MPTTRPPLTGPPLIGLTGRRRAGKNVKDFPKVFADATLDTYITNYSEAVAAAGGIPVLLTPDADVSALLERLDGVLLSGGSDIDPSFYGAKPDPKLGTVELERDRFELEIYERAAATELPLLGICRGIQVINVATGGTLIQHVDDHLATDRAPNTIVHDVKIEPNSELARLYGTERLDVNTLHHQVIDELGSGLKVTAHSPEGYVEGLEHTELPVVAVQWHPEMMDTARSDPIFSWIVETAAKASGRAAKSSA